MIPTRPQPGRGHPLMGGPLLAFTGLALLCLITGADAAPREPDAQGWSGSGWYVTSGAYPGTRGEDQPAAPVYILFSGPYPLQNECLEIHGRLYSPIGVCRFLGLKPAAFAG